MSALRNAKPFALALARFFLSLDSPANTGSFWPSAIFFTSEFARRRPRDGVERAVLVAVEDSDPPHFSTDAFDGDEDGAFGRFALRTLFLVTRSLDFAAVCHAIFFTFFGVCTSA